MPSMKLIKRRLTSVNNTKQIMKAMDLVAASKMQKYRTKLTGLRPLFNEAMSFFEDGLSDLFENEHVYLERPNKKRTAYVVISGDKGLCGGYNTNIAKKTVEHMRTHRNESVVITLGTRGAEILNRLSNKERPLKNITEREEMKRISTYVETAAYETAERVSAYLHRLYTGENLRDGEEQIDEIILVYTQFETILSHIPCAKKLLPLRITPLWKKDPAMIYEPDAHTFLKTSVPIYMSMCLYGAIMESSVCEQAARMTSMDSATRNAEEIIDDLRLMYNRTRQGIITQEINEIVSGANAI